MDNTHRPPRYALLMSCFLGAVAATGVRADDYLSYTGIANDLRTHAFLYEERDLLVYRAGELAERVVLYTCRNGAPFARKTVSYVDPSAPNFELDDTSDGLVEGIRSSGGQRVVFFRAARADPEKSQVLPNVPGLVADAGFDEFVRANWRALSGDQSVNIQFLIPSRLEVMGFRIGELRHAEVDGEPVEVFRLKLSGFFGWFLPGIDVYYGLSDHVLMRYVGVSDLRNSDGDNMKVDITFHRSDRKPATRDGLDNALRARLAPCT